MGIATEPVPVHRGIGARRLFELLLKPAIVYGAGLAIACILGLQIHGVLGWMVVSSPLATWLAVVALRAQRVCARIERGILIYEGQNPRADFELRIADIVSVTDGEDLVLIASDGRALRCELGNLARAALSARLRA